LTVCIRPDLHRQLDLDLHHHHPNGDLGRSGRRAPPGERSATWVRGPTRNSASTPVDD
jgi:hypothetical protein